MPRRQLCGDNINSAFKRQRQLFRSHSYQCSYNPHTRDPLLKRVGLLSVTHSVAYSLHAGAIIRISTTRPDSFCQFLIHVNAITVQQVRVSSCIYSDEEACSPAWELPLSITKAGMLLSPYEPAHISYFFFVFSCQSKQSSRNFSLQGFALITPVWTFSLLCPQVGPERLTVRLKLSAMIAGR